MLWLSIDVSHTQQFEDLREIARFSSVTFFIRFSSEFGPSMANLRDGPLVFYFHGDKGEV